VPCTQRVGLSPELDQLAAAACASRLSNHSAYGLDPSGRMYSSTRIFIGLW